jgi:ABC-type lipoprotein export system ATPase subunit
MTPLLSFVNVSKRYPDGGREIPVLDRISLEIDAGASVGVYGARRSGKSTLLRLAAGIVLADAGAVRFEGHDLAQLEVGDRGRLLRGAISFMAAGDWRASPGESVAELVAGALAREPRLLVLDEAPVLPNLRDRDRFFALLRGAARERNMALLIASAEMSALQGVGVLMSIADGELCSTGRRATVVPLPRRSSAAARRVTR